MSELHLGTPVAGGATSPARHAVFRRAILPVFCLLTMIFLAVGCGSSTHTTSSASSTSSASVPTRPVASGAAHALSYAAIRSARLGTSQAAFYGRFGSPALRSPASGTAGKCGFYYAVGYYPTQLLWRVCFKKQKLDLVASAVNAAHESGGSLVLNK